MAAKRLRLKARRWTTKWLVGKQNLSSGNLATPANTENDALVNILADRLAGVEV